MSDLMVVRLLRNPQGEEAPAGHRGDIVRVPDGRASLYLFPWEFEVADEARLRWLLAQKATPAKCGDSTDKTETLAFHNQRVSEDRAKVDVEFVLDERMGTDTTGMTPPFSWETRGRTSDQRARGR